MSILPGVSCGCPFCRAMGMAEAETAVTVPAEPQAFTTSGSSAIDAVLALSDSGDTARWNFPAAVGSPLSAPGGTGQAVTVTYSFATAVPSYYDAGSEPNSSVFTPLTQSQQAAARAALTLCAEVANITFTEVSDSGEGGQIRFGAYAMTGKAGYAYYPSFTYFYGGASSTITRVTENPIGGDIWLDTTATNLDQTRGTYGNLTLIHEIGHALGLKHPFETAKTLPTAEDNYAYSVMSYTEPANSTLYTVSGDASSYSWQSSLLVPRTPMLYDVAALQYLYGANSTTRSGDTVYSWGVSEAFFETIWDGGGTDTIDLSNQTLGSVVDLRPGTFSSIAVRQTSADLRMGIPSWASGVPDPTYNGRNNLAIAAGAVIEKAYGGSGNDRLTGNDAANDLRGGLGNDTLDGGEGDDQLFGQEGDDSLVGGAGNDKLFGWTGNDSLSGGAGNDELYGDAGNDTLDGGAGTDFAGIGAARAGYTLARASDGSVTVTETATGSVDTLIGVEGLGFSDGFVNLVQGNVGSWYYGTPFADTLTGTAGKDGLFGDLGSDSVSGGTGDDYFHAVAGDGSDTMDGGAGNDFAGYQAARAGYTIAMVDARIFTVTETASGQSDTLIDLEAVGFTDAYVGLIVQRFDNADGSTWNQGTYRADSIAGTAGVDGLRGGGGDDTLEGGAGRDYLEGEDGNDRLDGGTGNDYAWYGGARASFTLAKQADGSVTVTDGRDGSVDTLIGVEAVGFTDAPVVIVSAQRWDNADGSGWYDGSIFADSIAGTGSSDGMDGGLGDDTLLGGGGNDFIVGGAGNDLIDGEAGNDFLTGGAGADTFRFDAAAGGFDRVSDFDYAAGDRIGLAAGTTWGAFANAEGAWVSFGPGAGVLLAGIDHTKVNASWFVIG